MTFSSRLDLLDPLAAFQPEEAPEGLDKLVDLQEEIDPEGRKVKHKAWKMMIKHTASIS